MLSNFNFKNLLFVLLPLMVVLNINAQEADLGQIDIPNPSSYVENYEYDPVSDLYYFNIKVGDYDISYPIILSPEEYQNLILKIVHLPKIQR